jgi:tetratricopeptide (TPR) repeat protein
MSSIKFASLNFDRRPAATLLLFACLAGGVHAQSPRDLNVLKPASSQVPRGYALVIGVSSYKNLDAAKNLQFAETDADQIYRVLISQEGGAFPAENVHRLLGEQATLQNVRHELEEWLPSVAKPEDRVVVYFAGHGVVENEVGYFAPYDLDLDRIAPTAYPMGTMTEVLSNRVKARWKVLLTDACHSGKMNAETTDAAISARIDSSSAAAQFLSFAATKGNERSFEDPKLSTGFGLFSYFLAQGLQGNADNDPCDGWIRAGELVEYVRSNVRVYALEHGASQTPHAAGDFDPSMLLAKSNGCHLPQSMTGTAVIEVNLDDVEIFLDDRYVGKTSRDNPLSIPGLSDGPHTLRAAKSGYEDDVKQILIAPGQQIGVSIHIRYPHVVKPRAVEFGEKGERLLFTRRSTINPVNVLPLPRSQSSADLKLAREAFTLALKVDPTYARAYYELGIACQSLSDEPASISAFRRAIEIDPAFVEARIQFAGVLLERGDQDEAIRQLTESLRFDPSSDEAYSLIARAYLDKGVLDRCVESAHKAIDLNRANSMAHLWLADCVRKQADAAKSVSRFADAQENYREFLNLTNFSTPAYQLLAYHFFGFHIGGRAHPDRQASYDNLRKAGFLGICICERRTGNPLRAREDCERAIRYDPNDATSYFVLGLSQLGVFAKTESCSDAQSARASFTKMLSINGKLEEAKSARHYIDEIDGKMPALRRRGC